MVPSWSKFIYDLGLQTKLRGRTIYCTHPKEVQGIQALGGTKNPNIGKIIDIRPNLVITNKEENKKYDVNLLRAADLKIITTNAESVQDALEETFYLEFLLTGDTTRGSELLKNLKNFKPLSNPFSFVYLIWKEPLMAAGHRTYINSFLKMTGGVNLVEKENLTSRYPKITLHTLEKWRPDILFLPDEPYNFSKAEIILFESQLEESNIIPLDGKLSSWYGLDIWNNLATVKTQVEKVTF